LNTALTYPKGTFVSCTTVRVTSCYDYYVTGNAIILLQPVRREIDGAIAIKNHKLKSEHW